MRDVWTVTFVVVVYGVANGAFLTATPQRSLNLGLIAENLGLIGAGLPLGYGLSCLVFGQVFANFPGKYVLMGGATAASAAMFGMSQATTTMGCVLAQLSYGIACGAFWPFASAWLLDFQNQGVARTRLLRHYNVAWTSGTAAGMLLGGWVCKKNLVTETLIGAAVLALVAVLLASTAKKTSPNVAAAPSDAGAPAGTLLRVGFPILAAACISNLMALSLRGIELNNYAELNKALGFDAWRLGVLSATLMAAQLAAFFVGGHYERWLGLRRVYVLMGVGVMGVALGLAYSESLPVLILLMIVHGFLNAVCFQAGILAATGFFSRARTGTTFHEAIVGFGIMSPLPAGWLVASTAPLPDDPYFPLRAPLLAVAAFAVIGMVIQMILVGMRADSRHLLPGEAR